MTTPVPETIAARLREARHVAVLTGAGISAESGIPALVDSERILTQLRAEGYEVVGSYEDANLVVVNTCGFIDEAVAESLDAIGEAIERNGRVVVTGCLGARAESIREVHPKVLGDAGGLRPRPGAGVALVPVAARAGPRRRAQRGPPRAGGPGAPPAALHPGHPERRRPAPPRR